MKRKTIFYVMSLVLVLILALGMFVACNDNEEKAECTIIFLDGNTEVKSLKVEAGYQLRASDVPAGPEHAGKQFRGWYLSDGNVEVSTGFKVMASKTYAYAAYDDVAVRYTLKFIDKSNGTDVTVKLMEVEAGHVLAASEIPVAPEHESKLFDGWYTDFEQRVDVGFVVNSSATVAARYNEAPKIFKVTLKVGEDVFEEFSVEAGGTLSEIPTPENIDGYVFAGWFNGDDRLTANTVITANIVFIARYDRSAYLVSFREGNEVIYQKYIAIGDTLTAEDIPQNPTTGQDEIFVGWYANDVKAVAGLNIENDIEFVAFIVSRDAYIGDWIDRDKHLLVRITKSQLVVCDLDEAVQAEEEDIHFNVIADHYSIFDKEIELEVGSLSYGTYDGSWCFMLTPAGKIRGTNVAYRPSAIDGDEEGYIERAYNFDRCQRGSFNVGTYTYDNYTYIAVEDNGIVSNVNGVDVFYGYMYRQEEGYLLEYRNYSYNTFTNAYSVTIDENDNLLIDGKMLYIKNVLRTDEYTGENEETLRVFTRSNGYIYVIEIEGVSYYANIEGSLTDNTFFINYNGMRRIAKLVDDTLIISKGDYGTFDGVDGVFVFDGFGGGSLGGVEIEYAYNVLAQTVYVESKVYKLDMENGTYTVITDADSLEGVQFRYDYTSYAHLEITFDGFGRIHIVDQGSYAEFGTYDGYYSMSGNTIALNSNCSDLENGVYDITEDGNVIQKGFTALIKEGYTVQSQVEQFFGYWQGEGKDYVRIFYDEYYETYYLSLPNESDVSLKPNYNGTILYNADYDCYISMEGNTLKLEYKNQTKLFTYFGEYEPFSGFDSAYIGSWITGDGMRFEIGENDLTINDEGVTGLHLNHDYNEYEFRFESKDYKLYLDSYGQLVFEETDVYAFGKYLYNVSGKELIIGEPYIGTYQGEHNEIPIDLVIAENVITLNGVAPTYINVLGENEYGDYHAISFYMASGDFADQDMLFLIGSDISIRLVKSSEYIYLTSPLSQFNGKYLYEGESIQFDGKGNVVYFDKSEEHMAKYTVDDGKAYFTVGNLNFVCENQDSKHISVSITGGSEDRVVVFEVETIEISGTYSGDQNTGWHWSFTFTDEGTVSVICEEIDTYNETVSYTVGVNEEGETIIEFYLYNFYEGFVCKLVDGVMYVTSEYGSFTDCIFTKD